MDPANGCGRAFQLYQRLRTSSSPVAIGAFGPVAELLLPYIRSVVAARLLCRCRADYDDAVSDSCVAVLEALEQGDLRSQNSRGFRSGIRTIVLRSLIRAKADEGRRIRTEARYAETLVSPPDPAAVVASIDASRTFREQLIWAMMGRSRFVAVTPELCDCTVGWMLLDERDKRPLARELNDCGFWDRYFLARYLQTLYHWSRHDLREEVLAS